MPKRTDLHKILVIGSGPIVIGQAAEFDYAGTQACLALKEEGYQVVLINSNPATVMTDTRIADRVYMEPLNLEYVAKIIRKERPDAIVPGLGGQTGLNLAVQLAKKGVLKECQVEILGTSFDSIEQAEDRELFKELCERIGEPVLSSEIATSMEEGRKAAKDIGYPVVLRPAFTLGGSGGGFADNEQELDVLMENALKLSPVHQVLVEKSIKGYKEIEFEVMRDANDTAITVCSMENIDPVGIHTGDSIVVAPCQTLANREYQMLRDSALRIIRALKIEGGCNVQFALDPFSFQYYVIEVNPRVSRSSALASKATAYPIARVSAKIAVGMLLDEIQIANTPASFEPTLDYVVTKLPRFPFDKFTHADNRLSTQMKATGEVMSLGRTLEESILKAVRGLEIGANHLYLPKFDELRSSELLRYIEEGRDDRLFAIAEMMRRGEDIGRIYYATKIDMFFLEKLQNIVRFEKEIERIDFGALSSLAASCRSEVPGAGRGMDSRADKDIYPQDAVSDAKTDADSKVSEETKAAAAENGKAFCKQVTAETKAREALRQGRQQKAKDLAAAMQPVTEGKASPQESLAIFIRAKRMGISDGWLSHVSGLKDTDIYRMRESLGILPSYKMIDTCAAEFDSYTPYFYASYERENESVVSEKKKILVIGSGPIRIGQGVEFDFSTVHAIWAIREAGYEAIIINNNPETVSTDYTTSDKLYFEPLTIEDVMDVVNLEQPDGVIVTLGGQTAINLANRLDQLGVVVVGTSVDAVDRAENRDRFEKTLQALGIPQPEGEAVTHVEDGVKVAHRIGYPVLVRPSFVLGGRAMQIVYDDEQLRTYFQEAIVASEEQPVLIDKYISGKELEVDAICDGKDVLIPGIMQHVERTGVHSGDSISVFPTFSISEKAKNTILDYTTKLGMGLGMNGLYNIQFIVDANEDVYIIEVNPRSSRTVPFISKATGIPMADIAAKIALGHSIADQGYQAGLQPMPKLWYVKCPVFSFSKLKGADTVLSPEMKSTGEAIGYDLDLNRAVYKALQASGMRIRNYGTVFVTVARRDRAQALPLVRRFYALGFNIEATSGTAEFLKENGIRTRIRRKISEGSEEILEALRQGHIAYVVNTMNPDKASTTTDGFMIRRIAVDNGVTVFTSLDTVDILLNVLEDITMSVSAIGDDV